MRRRSSSTRLTAKSGKCHVGWHAAALSRPARLEARPLDKYFPVTGACHLERHSPRRKDPGRCIYHWAAEGHTSRPISNGGSHASPGVPFLPNRRRTGSTSCPGSACTTMANFVKPDTPMESLRTATSGPAILGIGNSMAQWKAGKIAILFA